MKFTRHTHQHPDLPKAINENPKPIKIDYEHITTPELTMQCRKGEILPRAGEVSGSGFHHDPGRAIEKSGVINITERAELPKGCYKFKWSAGGSKPKPSTLFPEDWTHAQTIEKVYESMSNTNTIKKVTDTRYTHLGQTTEGIPIISIVEIEQNAARVLSAYPDFKKYEEFLRTGQI